MSRGRSRVPRLVPLLVSSWQDAAEIPARPKRCLFTLYGGFLLEGLRASPDIYDTARSMDLADVWPSCRLRRTRIRDAGETKLPDITPVRAPRIASRGIALRAVRLLSPRLSALAAQRRTRRNAYCPIDASRGSSVSEMPGVSFTHSLVSNAHSDRSVDSSGMQPAPTKGSDRRTSRCRLIVHKHSRSPPSCHPRPTPQPQTPP